MQPFEQSWNDIVRFAESEDDVTTITMNNRNSIERADGAIHVRNLETQKRREVEKEAFRHAYRLLERNGELTLDDIEPELAGRKSIVLAILAAALDLETERQPTKIYAG